MDAERTDLSLLKSPLWLFFKAQGLNASFLKKKFFQKASVNS